MKCFFSTLDQAFFSLNVIRHTKYFLVSASRSQPESFEEVQCFVRL